MTITVAQARAVADVLAAAAKGAPVRQVHVEMRERAAEWDQVLADLNEVQEDGWGVELAGAITTGDRVLVWASPPYEEHPELRPARVIRVLHREGQTSIHLAHPFGARDLYLNRIGAASPVLVATPAGDDPSTVDATASSREQKS